MNGYCKTLRCFYGAQLDPSDDTWSAIKVHGDGVPIILAGGLKTEEEAEEIAGAEHQDDLQQNGQFGVGA